MDRLIELRPWLRLDEAATFLSKALEGNVTVADVLRLALDGNLELCVYLPAPLFAHTWLDDRGHASGNGNRIQGLCSLPLLGAGRVEVERQYNRAAGLAPIAVGRQTGAVVEHAGELYQLPHVDAVSGMFSYPSSAFPSEAVLVVERTALDAFVKALGAEATDGLEAAAQRKRLSTSWDGVAITFTAEDRVTVEAAGNRYSENYEGMGFADRRSEKPNRAWQMLRRMSASGGYLPVESVSAKPGSREARVGARVVIEERVGEIRKTLRAHFADRGIDIPADSDPVPFEREPKAYRTRFRLIRGPSFET